MLIKFVVHIFILVFISNLSIGLVANDPYGNLLDSSTVPTNSFLQNMNMDNDGVIDINKFDEDFENIVVCNTLTDFEKGSRNCMQNIHEIMSNKIYGINNNIHQLLSFASASAANSGVSSAKLLMFKYNSPGFNPYSIVTHKTPNQVLSGLVVIPLDANKNILSEDKIKGVLLYYHPTIISKNGIPSGYGDIDTISMKKTFYYQEMLTAIFTSNGYIVVAPDYIGQGLDVNTVHPYVVAPDVNALSGIYMLKALSTYLNQKYNFHFTNTNLYISSYSEGAAYSLKASELLQNNYNYILSDLGLKLKHTFGVSGAYDVSGTTANFLFDNVDVSANNKWSVASGCYQTDNNFCDQEPNGLDNVIAQYEVAKFRPMLGAYVVQTMLNYYVDSFSIFYKLFTTSNFYYQKNCVNFSTFNSSSISNIGDCSSLFNNNSKDLIDYINNKNINFNSFLYQLQSASFAEGFFIGNARNQTEAIALLSNPANSYTSDQSFMNIQLKTNKFGNDLIKSADTYHWTTGSPVSIIYLNHDSVVTNLNSLLACDPVKGIQGTSLGLVNCIPVDNSKLWEADSLFQSNQLYPTYLNHEYAEGILQIVALQQML